MKVVQYDFFEKDMMLFAEKLAANLYGGGIIYLYGDLGAGKTTFVRALMRGFNFEERVKSPTYGLVESYALDPLTVHHFDFYRIQNVEELQAIGIQEYFSHETLCLIEWPEKAVAVLPPPDLQVALTIHDDYRRITLTAISRIGERMLRDAN